MQKLIFTMGVFVVMALTAGNAFAQSVVTHVGISADSSYLQQRVCPVTVTFNGYISMSGPGTVAYRIVRSDGATGPIQSLVFPARGPQFVTETWTLGDGSVLPNYEGWVAIQVLTPNPVESDHAAALFHMTCSDKSPGQPRSARFRIIATGFGCSRETRDHVLAADGAGDEIYQAPFVVVAERSGATRVSVGGSGPIFRGIRTGATFPTATPHILSTPPIGLGFPGVLFEGELIEGERAVAIAPTLWEWDGPDRQLRAFFGACAAASDRVASAMIPRMTGALSDRLRGLISPSGGPITVPIAPEGDLDRPIGIQVAFDGSSASFRPEFQLFTYERAVQDSLFGTVTTFSFVDPDSHQGSYLLHVIVERIP